MSIVNVKLKNYMAFHKVKLQGLPGKGLFFISGINHDINGRNGIGKSALVESLVFSTYGKCIRPGSKDIKELITIGKRELETEILIDKYLIKRRRTKKQSEVRIFDVESGSELTKRTNTETDSFINQLLVPYEQFVFTNYFNPQLSVFFALTPKQKFQIMEQILGLQVLDDIHDEYKGILQSLIDESQKLNMKKVEFNTKKEMLENQIANLNQEISKLQKQIEQTVQKRQSVENELINKFNQLVQMFRNHYSIINDRIKALKNQLESIKADNGNIDEYDYNQLDNERQSITQKILELQNELNMLMMYSSSVKSIETGVCPTCGQKVSVEHLNRIIAEKTDGKITSINELHERINEIRKELNELNRQLSIINEKAQNVSTYNSIKAELNRQESELNKLLHEWRIQYPEVVDYTVNFDMSAQRRFVERYINEYNDNESSSDINTMKLIIENLQKQKQSLLQELNENESKLSDIENQLSQLTDNIEKLQLAVNELSHNGEFRQLFISSYIKELENTLNVMISKLHPHFKIKLDIVQSGRNKGLNVIVYDNGVEKSYAQLSTGERRMVDMSLMLAFSTLNNMFIIIDEALDALSYENQVKVINLLSSLNKQVFIVTHNQKLIDEFEHPMKKVIWIEKENGEAKVELA